MVHWGVVEVHSEESEESSRCLVLEVSACVKAVATACIWGHIKASWFTGGRIASRCCQGKGYTF